MNTPTTHSRDRAQVKYLKPLVLSFSPSPSIAIFKSHVSFTPQQLVDSNAIRPRRAVDPHFTARQRVSMPICKDKDPAG